VDKETRDLVDDLANFIEEYPAWAKVPKRIGHIDLVKRARKAAASPEPEVVDEWWEVQYSRKGANDWNCDGAQNDSLARAKRMMGLHAMEDKGRTEFEYRIARRAVTEVIEE
jgi:hypothetical protein